MAWIGHERFWEAQGETPNPRRAREDGEESQRSTYDIRAAGISEQVGLKAPALVSSPDAASVFEWGHNSTHNCPCFSRDDSNQRGWVKTGNEVGEKTKHWSSMESAFAQLATREQ